MRCGTSFIIEFYETSSGRRPVEEFLDSLDIKTRVKALDSLTLLEEFGNKLREPYSKFMEDGIFELRIRFAGDIARIFYFFYSGRRIILTNGFIKKTMKTPKDELRRAHVYKEDYERRRRNE